MAAQRSSKPSESTTSAPKSEDKDFVAPVDGTEHGFIGQRPAKNNDDFTVAGVTGATANVNDKPTSA